MDHANSIQVCCRVRKNLNMITILESSSATVMVDAIRIEVRVGDRAKVLNEVVAEWDVGSESRSKEGEKRD